MRVPRASTLSLVLIGASLIALLSSRAAQAEVGAAGLWISFPNVAARGYMAYGHIAEPEVYAPIGAALAKQGVRLRVLDDMVELTRDGKPLAQWIKITTPDDAPETGEPEVVIHSGGQLYLPLRAVAALLGMDVDWVRDRNLARVVPSAVARAAAPKVLEPEDAPRLTEVTLTTQNGALNLTINATGPASITQFKLASPDRIVFDIVDAVWAEGVSVPASAAQVKTIRHGQFQETIARLVLEIADATLECVALSEGAHRSLTARLARGQAVQALTGEQLQAMRRREEMRLASRGGGYVRPPSLLPGDGGGSALPEMRRLPIPRASGNLNGRVICVDAGHGGKSPGARASDGFLEKTACLRMAQALHRALEQAGARVIMTRNDDSYVSLEERWGMANARGADLFISIHCNSNPRPNSVRGTETYYFTPQSELLARAIHPELRDAVGQRDGGIRGNRSFAVIRATQMPSVLLEVGYINHDADAALLRDPAFHVKVAASVRDGVLRYYAALSR